MGTCVSTHLLNQEDDFTHISHHIVSLTSTTYGLLTLDPSPTTVAPTPPRFTTHSPPPEPPPDVINSWELMAGLDSTADQSFTIPPKPSTPFQENTNPNHKNPIFTKPTCCKSGFLDGFEPLCPPKGENRVVIYTTTLRGVRKTFEACNAVRAAFEGFGVSFCERDVSMDRGFRDELWELMKGKGKHELVPPRVFVKGRYVGGCEEVLKMVEEGCFGQLVEGLPRSKAGYVCEVCGGARFLPCVVCDGSCKMVVVLKEESEGKGLGESVCVKCSNCNENGLVCCPICS